MTSSSNSQDIGPSTSSQANRDDDKFVDEESNKQATSGKDDDIAALAEGIGNVSLTPIKNSDKEDIPPALQHLADLLSSEKYRKIVVLTGAGVSCSAGIPDFRTPGTGLYDNLQKYNLPCPEHVFDLHFYKRDPLPFVQLASELWPGLRHSPTLTHSFIALLDRKGMLLRNYTQNIDMLESLAGVPEEKIVECHGHFRTASCTSCSLSADIVDCKRRIVEEQEVPTCLHCKGYVKPDIVFFSEGLPSRFGRLVQKDMKQADLLLVMGTSLRVGPVNAIPEMVSNKCPRFLLNRELVGDFLRRKNGRTKKKKKSQSDNDFFHQGDCDDSIQITCNLLGWDKELKDLNLSTRVDST